jgi:predicted nucleotidyltransferase
MAGSVVAALSASEQAALEEFARLVRRELGPDLLELRLFGSRARGEGHAESDLDVAVMVVDGARARRYAVYDAAHDTSLRHGVLIAPTVIEQGALQELRDSERLFARELERDGVAL